MKFRIHYFDRRLGKALKCDIEACSPDDARKEIHRVSGMRFVILKCKRVRE